MVKPECFQARLGQEWTVVENYGRTKEVRIEPSSPASQVDFLSTEPPESPYICLCVCIYIYGCVCVCMKEKMKVKVMSDSLQPHGLYSPWNSAGQNTGVGSHSLLQGIFPTQG